MNEHEYVLRIVEAISRLTGIKKQDILGPSRVGQVARVRFTAQYLARKNTTLSFPDIGAIFGARNHSTVISACNKEALLLSRNALFRGKFSMQTWHNMVLAEAAALELAAKEVEVQLPKQTLVEVQVLNNPLFRDSDA